MFCGNCGKQIEDTSNVCPHCGTMVDKEIPIGDESYYEKIFVEPDEKHIGSLGSGYLNSFLTGRGLKRCIVLLSDKRIYLSGNMIDINGGKLKRRNTQKTVDLEDITGTGFFYSSNKVWKLIVAVLSFIIGLIVAVIAGSEGESEAAIGILCGVIVFAAILILSYFYNRETLFAIEYAGGCIKFNISISALAESKDFEKQIRRAKNRVKGKI